MKNLLKRIIVWAIRKAIQAYPDESFVPEGKHLRRNPKRKPKPLTEAASLKEIYPEGRE
jgi:hypothetical protein